MPLLQARFILSTSTPHRPLSSSSWRTAATTDLQSVSIAKAPRSRALPSSLPKQIARASASAGSETPRSGRTAAARMPPSPSRATAATEATSPSFQAASTSIRVSPGSGSPSSRTGVDLLGPCPPSSFLLINILPASRSAQARAKDLRRSALTSWNWASLRVLHSSARPTTNQTKAVTQLGKGRKHGHHPPLARSEYNEDR